MKQSKTYKALDELDYEALYKQLEELRAATNDMLDILTGTGMINRTKLITILCKASLVRKYAAWLRANGGIRAEISVVRAENGYRVAYRYKDYMTYTPLSPATRFDKACKCWKCGKVTDYAHYCYTSGCYAYVCVDCEGTADTKWCPLHKVVDNRHKLPSYKRMGYHKCTVGLEIETERRLSASTDALLKTSPLIAGWAPDCSLPAGALEYQTQPLTMSDIPALQALLKRLPCAGKGKAGGHMHVARTERQTCGRWYHALKGLTSAQAEALNMRHTTDDTWCTLARGYYDGKHTAVNGEHERTIELRTFGAWDKTTSNVLMLAVAWVHAMWRLFESYPLRALKSDTIHAYATRVAAEILTTPLPSLEDRLKAHKARKTAVKRQESLKLRQHVLNNIRLSRTARASHGRHNYEWLANKSEREYRRNRITYRLTRADMCAVWPNDRHYMAKVARYYLTADFKAFTVHDARTGSALYDERERMARHIARNIEQSRKARESHAAHPLYTQHQLVRILARKRLKLTTSRTSRGMVMYALD